jgi:hypothetical protein
MRRLLIVSPHFPPANGADCHRARVLAPLLSDYGWETEILAVNPNQLTVPLDPWLANGLTDVAVHRAEALSLRWTKVPGLGTLTYRARPYIRSIGNRLIQERRYDLIYFSTTSFALTTLGPYWKNRFGVPFAVDYQDPWITDYYRLNPTVKPPGGKLKYGATELLSRFQEPNVLRNCIAITSVSPDYPKQLKARYPFFAAPSIVLPFPGAQRDFDRITSENVTQNIFDTNDGKCHWVSLGVSGQIMYKALGALFRAIAEARRNLTAPKNLMLHFIGTSYAPPGKGVPVIMPLAQKYGLSEIVHEQTDRVPYSVALKCLLDSHALIATGSNDSTYNASKLLPYILAKRPFLAIFHQASPAAQLLRTVGGATNIEFSTDDTELQMSQKIKDNWLNFDNHTKIEKTNEACIQEHTDNGQALLLSNFFEQALSSGRSRTLG